VEANINSKFKNLEAKTRGKNEKWLMSKKKKLYIGGDN